MIGRLVEVVDLENVCLGGGNLLMEDGKDVVK